MPDEARRWLSRTVRGHLNGPVFRVVVDRRLDYSLQGQDFLFSQVFAEWLLVKKSQRAIAHVGVARQTGNPLRPQFVKAKTITLVVVEA
jgi:hypothetical protein